MCNKPARGLTLIELMVFIVVVGIAANAMLGVFSSLTRSSANLLPDKQAQAVASSLMNEILAQPFTFCDPDAPNADTAANVAACGAFAEAIGPEAGPETRNGGTPFDNVNDYHSVAQIPASRLNQPLGAGVALIPGLLNYSYQVIIAPTGLPNVPLNAALLITVTVTAPNGAVARLQGIRVRYAPTT